MFKVGFFDKKIGDTFYKYATGITGVIAAAVLFWDIPDEHKTAAGILCIVVLIIIYILIWINSNRLKSIDLSVEGSTVTIKTGDIFTESGFKVIAFNEYFDTQVDDRVISRHSLNGLFVTQHLSCSVEQLDSHIQNYNFSRGDVLKPNISRESGKKQKYALGTICVCND